MRDVSSTQSESRVGIADIETEHQIRSTLAREQIRRLSESMQESGQQVPIRLRRTRDRRLVVLDGHCRLAAAIDLGWTDIWAIVEESPMSDSEIMTVQLATQCRFGLNPMERAFAYSRQLKEDGMTAARLAAIAGVSEAQVSRTRALADIRSELQEMVAQGVVGPSLALLLNKVADQERYLELLQRARAGKLTRTAIEQNCKPSKRTRSRSKRAKSPRRVIQIGQGCTIKLGASVRTMGEVIDLLTKFIDSVGQSDSESDDGLVSMPPATKTTPVA